MDMVIGADVSCDTSVGVCVFSSTLIVQQMLFSPAGAAKTSVLQRVP